MNEEGKRQERLKNILQESHKYTVNSAFMLWNFAPNLAPREKCIDMQCVNFEIVLLLASNDANSSNDE